MNFALSDEQMLLREAARGSLARVKTIEAARTALEDPASLPDLWPVAVEAGWPGVLIDETRGGAGLGGFDALLVPRSAGASSPPSPCWACCRPRRSSTPPATATWRPSPRVSSGPRTFPPGRRASSSRTGLSSPSRASSDPRRPASAATETR
jgi:hypothetical protein